MSSALSAAENARLREIIAKEAIRESLVEYARGVDRRAYELVRATYHPDAYDDHGPYKGGVDGFLEWVERRHEQVEQSMHFLGNCRIEIVGDVAAVETYGLVFQRFAAGGSDSVRMYAGEGTATTHDTSRMLTAMRYVDRFEQRDGAWKVARRVVVIETIWHPSERENIPDDAMWTLATRDRTDALWSTRAEAGVDGSTPG